MDLDSSSIIRTVYHKLYCTSTARHGKLKSMAFKNPFHEGDIIWWVKEGFPSVFGVVLEHDRVRIITSGFTYSLQKCIQMYKSDFIGPFKVEKFENWSQYDFLTED